MKDLNVKTLKDVLPQEFLSSEYNHLPAYKIKDVEVLREHSGHRVRWPGKHKNVHFWVELANGKAVGWNENPKTGWSFPVINMS